MRTSLEESVVQIRSHVGSRHDGVVDDDDDDTTTMTTTEKFYRRRPTCPMTRWLCRCKSYRRRLSLSGASHMTATVILTCHLEPLKTKKTKAAPKTVVVRDGARPAELLDSSSSRGSAEDVYSDRMKKRALLSGED